MWWRFSKLRRWIASRSGPPRCTANHTKSHDTETAQTPVHRAQFVSERSGCSLFVVLTLKCMLVGDYVSARSLSARF